MSSPISDEQRARKRQKYSHDSTVHHSSSTTPKVSINFPINNSTMSVVDSPTKSSLKGRRRYNADVEDMIRASERGFGSGTLRISGTLWDRALVTSTETSTSWNTISQTSIETKMIHSRVASWKWTTTNWRPSTSSYLVSWSATMPLTWVHRSVVQIPLITRLTTNSFVTPPTSTHCLPSPK